MHSCCKPNLYNLVTSHNHEPKSIFVGASRTQRRVSLFRPECTEKYAKVANHRPKLKCHTARVWSQNNVQMFPEK